ncbi:hypothetical protein HYE67_007416 [Fusarium culmorum]|uniref:Uncharacterized protein n=1 Tax=Fusarium culmorum TaxID=5516 RepID=A0A2T4H3E0_FUSCU|nr:hypothetical protein FCULG_00008495 [Fusarium culmorum]QPC65185.1 hypothetical protein HYE67_007416 [Fusarium culmorum]
MQVRRDKRRRVSKEEKLHCSATSRKSIQGLIDDQFQVLVRLEDIVNADADADAGPKSDSRRVGQTLPLTMHPIGIPKSAAKPLENSIVDPSHAVPCSDPSTSKERRQTVGLQA